MEKYVEACDIKAFIVSFTTRYIQLGNYFIIFFLSSCPLIKTRNMMVIIWIANVIWVYKIIAAGLAPIGHQAYATIILVETVGIVGLLPDT